MCNRIRFRVYFHWIGAFVCSLQRDETRQDPTTRRRRSTTKTLHIYPTIISKQLAVHGSCYRLYWIGALRLSFCCLHVSCQAVKTWNSGAWSFRFNILWLRCAHWLCLCVCVSVHVLCMCLCSYCEFCVCHVEIVLESFSSSLQQSYTYHPSIYIKYKIYSILRNTTTAKPNSKNISSIFPKSCVYSKSWRQSLSG